MDSGNEAAARGKARSALRQLLLRSARPQPVRVRGSRFLSGRLALRICLAAAAFVFATALLVGGGVGVLLARGPISLESLKPSLEQSLQEKLGGRYRVSIGPLAVTADHGGFGIGVGGIQINDLGGRTVVAAPHGRIGLDVLALLFQFEAKVRRIEFDGLVVRLRVHPDGTVSVAAAPSTDAAPIELSSSAPAGLGLNPGVAALTAINALTGDQQALDHVALRQGHLEVVNEGLTKTSVYEDLTLAFDKSGDSAKTSISARGAGGLWSLEAHAKGGANRELNVQGHNLSVDDLRLLDSGPPPFDTDMPLSFNLQTSLDPDGGMRALEGAFKLGAGYFKLADPNHEPLLMDGASASIHWDAAARRYQLERIEALSGASHYRFDGEVTPPSSESNLWRGKLRSTDIVMAGERPGELPVSIDSVDVSARFNPSDRRFNLDRMALHGPHLQGEMNAELRPDGDGVAVKLDIQVGPSVIADVMRLWPTFINPEARDWCLENLKGGQVSSGGMKVDWTAADVEAVTHDRAAPADSVHGEFQLLDTSAQLLPGLPPLTGADAAGVITGREFDVSAKRGFMEFAGGRRIQATDIFFHVPDTSPSPKVAAQAGAHVQGGAEALADLLTRDAIKRFAGFSVDPANVKGTFQGKLGLDLYMGKVAKPDDQRFHAEGTLSNLQLDKYVANERFEQGQLDVTADSSGLKISGQGVVNGIPAKIDLARSGSDDGILNMNFTIDDALRAKLGLNNALPMNGPFAARVRAPLGKATADVEVDFQKTEILTPEGTVLKAAGKPGKATFSLKSQGDVVTASSLTVDAGLLTARGSVQLGADGALQNAKLTQLRFAPGDDLRLDLAGGPVLKATLRGGQLDARGAIKGFLGKDSLSGGAKDLDLDLKVSSVLGFNQQSIAGFELALVRRGGVIRSIQAKGRFANAALTASKDDSGLLIAHSEDAGAFARFLDLYTKLEGGSLDLTMRDTPDGGQAGTASVLKFVLHNEGALREMAAGANSATRPVVPQEDFNSENTRFQRMTATFTRLNGRLDLREALIFNPTVGLTAQGYIDFAHDKMDINGTFVPAYGVNTLVTGIPLFGILLGGGKHEGIFGVNYRITGPASGPTLTVNPLSGVTPGILRKIMGVMDGTTPAQDPNPKEAQ